MHYQTENTVSAYLQLRYTVKYYIYKYSEVKVVAEEFESDHQLKKGAYIDNLLNFYNLYDEIYSELQKDRELMESILDYGCYPDLQMNTLTADISRRLE